MTPRTKPFIWQPPRMAEGEPERILAIVRRLHPQPVATHKTPGSPIGRVGGSGSST